MCGKISVIVPVYNNEKYLDKCINSVLKQTYKNLEIIIIDDGSTDSSLDICKRFKETDSRIIIFHQDKSGPSCARNTGIKISTGEFLAFVDGDDWIEETVYQSMIENTEKEKADIAFCGHFVDNEKSGKQTVISSEDKIMEQKDFIEFLISNKGNDFVWNKLFRKSSWGNIQFPEGKVYEDIAVMNMIMRKSCRVVYIGTPYYHYVQHDGSITRNKASSNLLDGVHFRMERYLYMKNNYSQFESSAKRQLIDFVLWIQYLINNDKGYDKKLIDSQPELEGILKEYSSGVGIKLFVVSKMVLYTPFLFKLASKIVYRVR